MKLTKGFASRQGIADASDGERVMASPPMPTLLPVYEDQTSFKKKKKAKKKQRKAQFRNSIMGMCR